MRSKSPLEARSCSECKEFKEIDQYERLCTKYNVKMFECWNGKQSGLSKCKQCKEDIKKGVKMKNKNPQEEVLERGKDISGLIFKDYDSDSLNAKKAFMSIPVVNYMPMNEMIPNDDTSSYVYDSQGKLIGKRIEFVYDVHGNRIGRKKIWAKEA